MKVFQHHIYEYRKGLRSLILHTLPAIYQEKVEALLTRENISYLIYPLGRTRINLFFGAGKCVEVVASIGKSSLSDYTPEEDFILGTMLGYSRLQQCTRYLVRKDQRLVQKAEDQTGPLLRNIKEGTSSGVVVPFPGEARAQ
ncbi:MAG: DUF2023 family protein [Deltaproteobacteria bacterium]|nr:DUF2023 family protein [Deltaproteobacteria bacterium]